MGALLDDTIRAAWAQIDDPYRTGDIIASGRVQSLRIRDDIVQFVLAIAPEEAKGMQPVLDACEAAARPLAGTRKVRGVLTAHRDASTPPDKAAARAPNTTIPDMFQHVQSVIAVASGKGGVGKSTVAVNLASCFAQTARAGLLDADIYGPSLPQLLGVTDKPAINKQRQVLPTQRFGMATMSIGYMVPPDQAMVWRGPVVQRALMQMLTDVVWPKLDVLVLDLPPGTGDVQLTMAQRMPVHGALIVTTPQALALADVRRACAMFRRVHIPVLGVVENMAYLDAPDGTRLTPFGSGGGAAIAKELDVPLLGQLPLDEQQHHANEAGKPMPVFAPHAPITQAYAELAEAVKRALRRARAETPQRPKRSGARASAKPQS